MRYKEIVVIGGREYVDIAKKVFKGKRIITPLQGLGGIGRMISAMKSAIRAGREIK